MLRAALLFMSRIHAFEARKLEMAREEIISNFKFRLKHLGHRITEGNSGDGRVLICDSCDVVNTTPEQEAGTARGKSMEQWIAFHQGHGGEISNYGGGTLSDLFCTKCGSSY